MKHSWVLCIVSVLALAGTAGAASTLYAATPLGPFKSTDGGLTWKQLTVTSNDPALPGLPMVLSIAVAPQMPSTVYAHAKYSSPAGFPIAFLKSTDSGATWSVVSKPTFQPAGFGLLAIDAANANVLYTMNDDSGVEVSADGGVTWTAPAIPMPSGSASGGTSNQPSLQSVTADPTQSGVVYADGPNAGSHPGKGYVVKSTDFGNTWSVLAKTDFAGRIYVDPKNSLTLYGTTAEENITVCTATNGGACGLYKSTDGGQTWAELSLPAFLVHGVAFDITPGVVYAAAEPGTIATAALDLYKSADGGNTWTVVLQQVGGTGGNPLTADPNTASTLYAVAGQAPPLIQDATYVSRSTDGGARWTSVEMLGCALNQTICSNTALVYDLAVAPQSPAAGSLPAVTSVINAAGYQPGIVANSWVTIQGTNLALQTDDWSNSIVNGALPTLLDGVSVSMGGQPAYVYYISPGQLNVLAPDVPAGPIAVTVTTASGTSAAFATTASAYGPAFFMWPGSQVVATRQDYSYAVAAGTFAGATTVPAAPGDVLILWATGFGPTTPAAPAGVAVPSNQSYATSTMPTVTIDNTPATVYGAALAPDSVGLYQIAIQVPTTLANGTWPIQAMIGGVSSPAGTVLTVQQ